MRILRLHIENFGRLHDLDMDFLEDLTVIRGDNGWGKSTLAAFIKAMFYGLPYTTKRSLMENDRKRFLPWQGGAFGGSLEFEAGEQTYRVERFFGAKEKEDTFDLYDLRTGLVSLDYTQRLGEELFGVDRKAYERSTFLGQQDHAVFLNDSLSARLTQVEEDIGDMQNYERAVSSLEEQMKYYLKTGGRGQIGKLEKERYRVRGELMACTKQEDEIEELEFAWKARKKLEEEAARRAAELERKLQSVWSGPQTEAKRKQYELLRRRAEEQQAAYQKTAEMIDACTSRPAGEEELDRCREQIYQLDSLFQREEGAVRQVQEAVSRLGDAEDAKQALSSPWMRFTVLAVLVLGAGGLLLLRGMRVPGAAALAGAVLLFLLGLWKHRRYRERAEQLDVRIQESSRSVREAEHALGSLHKKQDALERKIDAFLGAEKGTKPEELERFWKEARAKSREYDKLLQRYEAQREEANRSRALWVQYEESLSDTERKMILSPQGGEPEARILKSNLEREKANLECFRKEQEELRYQIKGFREQAERIPELQEQEAALSEQIAEAVREHGLLEQTVQYLKRAREQFSVHYLRELKERLGYYLEELEPGRPIDLSLDVSLQMKVQEMGAYRSLETQSTGQQELLYYAERLAVIDVLYQEEQPCLILDDPFTNLDTARQRRALELLRRLSGKRQMIYLTCRDA